MADQSITQLPVANTVTGDEVTVIVQQGITKQVAITLIANAVAPGKLITNIALLPNYYIEFFYSDGTTSNCFVVFTMNIYKSFFSHFHSPIN